MLKNIEFQVPSNLINALNFLIFDIILISLVYYLTADVMGRLNDFTLRDGEPRRLIITCPPVLGGGLCTTHRSRSLLLLFARLLGLGLILMTNLTINGEARSQYVVRNERLLAPGNISSLATDDEFFEKVLLRSSCQGSRPSRPEENEGNKTIVYYGELRGANSSECVVNRTLLTGTVVEYGTEILNRSMSTGMPCHYRNRTARGKRVVEAYCPKAVLSCLVLPGETLQKLESCRGLLTHEGLTYMTEEGSAFPEMELEPTEARLVRGINISYQYWLDGIFISTATLKDALDATFAAQTVTRPVRKADQRQWTIVNPLWFAALAFKVLLVLALAFASISLKYSGYHTVAHDEQRLAELLSARVEENSRPSVRQSEVERGGIYLHAEQSVDGLLFTADSQPRTRPSTPGQAGQGSRRRNSDLHRLEEMYT